MTIAFDNRALDVRLYSGSQALDITGLHVYVSVDLSRKKHPDRAVVTIHNLGESKRGSVSYEHQALEISAGYDEPGKIFSGVTTVVSHSPPNSNRPGWETTIEALDGVRAYQDSWVTDAWPSGTPLSAIATSIVKQMELASDVRVTGRLSSEWAFNGRAQEALTELCDDNDLQWCIRQGVVEVLPEADSIDKSDALAVLVSADHGMLESPELVKRGKRGRGDQFGISCKTLLNPNIRPNGLVKIESRVIGGIRRTKGGKTYATPGANGVFRVQRVAHYGSLYTDDFYTEFETESISA